MKKAPDTAAPPPAFDDLATAEAYVATHPGEFIISTRHHTLCPRVERDQATCTCRPWYVPMSPDVWNSSRYAAEDRPARSIREIQRGRR